MSIPRTRLLDRDINVRDATLFVVASEGKETERQYFEGFKGAAIKVVVLPTGEDNRCDPKSVMNRLQEFREKYDLGVNEDDDVRDELWLALDVDRWPKTNLRSVCKEAKKKGFGLAISNPCFELWLYLHISENDLEGDEFQALIDRKKGTLSKAMEARLRERLADQGGYQKAHLQFHVFRPKVRDAIVRAKALDVSPGELWPSVWPRTQVYRLVEKILARRPTPEGF